MIRLTLIFCFFVLTGFSQKENAVWCFGDSAGIDFNDVANPTLLISGMNAKGTCATIADSIGNLLFYYAG